MASTRKLQVAVVLLALVASLMPGPVHGAPEPERLAGDDRFATAAAISAATFAPSPGVAYVATAEAFPDALAAGPLAGVEPGPVLLAGRGTLPSPTRSELERLRPERIVVLGGEAALSGSVAAELEDLTDGSVTRLAGADRFETAARISAAGFTPGVATAYVATGQNFPDALAGGAAGATAGGPVLLTGQGELPPATRAELERLAPTSIAVLGGPAAVSDAVVAALSELTAGRVRRLAGPSRFATAAAVSADTFPDGAPAVLLATGRTFPDALAGAPAAAAAGGPLLLVESHCAPDEVVAEVERLAPTRTIVLGGLSAVSDAAAQLTPCSTPPPPPPEPPPDSELAFEVDETLRPALDSLPGLAPDDPPRPLARLVDPQGIAVDFVADELLVMTDDPDALEEARARWGATVVSSTPAVDGIDVPAVHLLHFNPAGVDTTELAADVRELEPTSVGTHTVSSTEGVGVIAAAADGAADGMVTAPNWLQVPHGYVDRVTTEAPETSGQVLASPPPGSDRPVEYSSNAFTWNYLNAGSTQDFGVTEAWRALAIGGRLDNRVRLSVIDGGFQSNNPDYPAGASAQSVLPAIPPLDTTNPFQSDKAWHGTNVAIAAAGVPNNGWGSAGSGGPVVDLRMVYTTGDMFFGIAAVLAGVAQRSRILNMSYGAPVPWTLSWSVLPFEKVTSAARSSGMLLFASAGNDRSDVDSEVGFGIEGTWHAPCENAGVICVGGLQSGQTGRAISTEPGKGSSYGYESCERAPCDVELFGPYTMYAGSDPQFRDNKTRAVSGTSFASPFVAGVAALIWAANPGLTNDQVEGLLYSTARISPDPTVGRYVNARAAVLGAFGGNVPPLVRITEPADGAAVHYGGANAVHLAATTVDVEDGDDVPASVVWTTDVDGRIGEELTLDYVFPSSGPRVLTVTVTDRGGATRTATVHIDVVNNPPQVRILSPDTGDQLYVDVAYTFDAEVQDQINAHQPELCPRVTWDSDFFDDPFPVSGCRPVVTFPMAGARTLTASFTDDDGLTATETVDIDVVEQTDDQPPVVVIDQPFDGEDFLEGETIPLRGSVQLEDGEDTPVEYGWTINGEVIQETEDVDFGPDSPAYRTGEGQILIFGARDDDGYAETSITIRIAARPK